MSVLSVVTIVFIILKLVDVINWSWWWVLAPTWVPMILTFLFFVFTSIIGYIAIKKDEKEVL